MFLGVFGNDVLKSDLTCWKIEGFSNVFIYPCSYSMAIKILERFSKGLL